MHNALLVHLMIRHGADALADAVLDACSNGARHVVHTVSQRTVPALMRLRLRLESRLTAAAGRTKLPTREGATTLEPTLVLR